MYLWRVYTNTIRDYTKKYPCILMIYYNNSARPNIPLTDIIMYVNCNGRVHKGDQIKRII